MRIALLFGSMLIGAGISWIVSGLNGWGIEGYVTFCVVLALIFHGVHQLASRHYIREVVDRLEAIEASGKKVRPEDNPFEVPQWEWGNGKGPLPNWVIGAGFASFGFFFATIPGFVAAQFD